MEKLPLDESTSVVSKIEQDEEDLQEMEPEPSKITSQYCYCMLNNIPGSFRTGQLRNFFSEYIEAEKFDMFHFRHRPQLMSIKSCDNYREIPETLSDRRKNSEGENVQSLQKKCCCVVRFISDLDRSQFIGRYHLKFWMDKEGNDLPMRCIINKVSLGEEDLQKFANKELRPPNFMPRGNVGTPNGYFLDLIKTCRLPPSLIKKLDLEFPRARKFKRYSKVPMDYGTTVIKGSDDQDEIETKTGKGHEISDTFLSKGTSTPVHPETETKDSDNESNADDDDDRCEEWERHEALHDHRTTHGDMNSESKERLYESEIELQWEKGGPGIVWYTDAVYWDQQKGGFDERTADDWDVDMEAYYDPSAGDKDARDLIDMRRSERVRNGLETVSLFKKPPSEKPGYSGKINFKSGGNTPGSSTSSSIGAFEKHTRGIGRKVMENFGWKDGLGLGKTIKGIPEALENEGQGPRDKRGFGFYGEKLELGNPAKSQKSLKDYDIQAPDRIVIGTIYDKPEDLDIPDSLKRRNAPTFIKRYDSVKDPPNKS